MKFVLALPISLILFGCSEITERGTFRTDQEMMLELANEIENFDFMASQQGECADNNQDCAAVKKHLGVGDGALTEYENYQGLAIKYILFSDYRIEYDWLGLNSYSKGFLFDYNGNIEGSLFYLTESLDKHPNDMDCYERGSSRIVAISNPRVTSGWYIYAQGMCD